MPAIPNVGDIREPDGAVWDGVCWVAPGGDLRQALEALAEAKPDVAKVEALTAATIRRRETPYEPHEVFQMRGADMLCYLCGGRFDHVPSLQLANHQHVKYHNDTERRLRKLESSQPAAQRDGIWTMTDAEFKNARAEVWDEGFTACAREWATQRGDPSHPITRLNPYH